MSALLADRPYFSSTSNHNRRVMWGLMVNIIWYIASLTPFQRYAWIIIAKVSSVLWWKVVFESGERCRLPKRIAVKACLHSKTRLLQKHVEKKIRCILYFGFDRRVWQVNFGPLFVRIVHVGFTCKLIVSSPILFLLLVSCLIVLHYIWLVSI